MQSRMADNSFLGIVASINLDFDSRIEQDQFPDFSFLPAYTKAPPANSAVSARQINLIRQYAAPWHLYIIQINKRCNNVCPFGLLYAWNICSSQSKPFSGSIANFICNLISSQKPQGSYNSATFDKIVLLVNITEFRSFSASSLEFTGVRLGFLDPLIFLLRFSSPKPGERRSGSVVHLYQSIFTAFPSTLYVDLTNFLTTGG